MKNKIKKPKDEMLCKRFSSEDTAKWQEAANKECGGNLTLWMETRLNEAAKNIFINCNYYGVCKHENWISFYDDIHQKITVCSDCKKSWIQ